MGSKLVNLEDLNSKITSSKLAVFSLFVRFLLVLFRLHIFFYGDSGLGVNGIGYHFERLDSQVDPTKRVYFFSYAGSNSVSNYVSVILD